MPKTETVAWPARSIESWRYVNAKQVHAWFFDKTEIQKADDNALCLPGDDLIQRWQAQGLAVIRDETDAHDCGFSLCADDQKEMAFERRSFWQASPMNAERACAGWSLTVPKSHPPVLWVLGAQDDAVFYRHSLTVAKGASLSLVILVKDNAKHVQNHLHRIRLEQGARLTLTVIYADTGKHWHEYYVEQAKDSHFKALPVHMAAADGYTRESYHGHLAGDGSTCSVHGLVCGIERSQVDQVVEIVHGALHTVSDQSCLQLLSDAAQGGFHSEARVQAGAKHSRSAQNSRSLLFSKKARSHIKPRLRIDHDDVQCQHGAVIGQLDEQALFYLQTRGLGEDEARYLLIQGFMEGFLAHSDLPIVSAWLSDCFVDARSCLLKGDG